MSSHIQTSAHVQILETIIGTFVQIKNINSIIRLQKHQRIIEAQLVEDI